MFRKFPYFPNPHIRSNCFLIDRSLLLSLDFRLKLTKLDCQLFESGSDGLSAKLLGLGLRLLVVGRTSRRAYDVADSAKSWHVLDVEVEVISLSQAIIELMSSALLWPPGQCALRNLTMGRLHQIRPLSGASSSSVLSSQRSDRLLFGSVTVTNRFRSRRQTSRTRSRSCSPNPQSPRASCRCDGDRRGRQKYNWELIVFADRTEERLRVSCEGS